MKKLRLIYLILVLGIIVNSNSFAAKDDKLNIKDAASVGGAKIYPYLQYTIYTIYCRPDRLVDIVLQPGEQFKYIGGADTVRWTIDQELFGNQWHVFVKPNTEDPNLSTSLIIGTDRHCYRIEAFVSKQDFTPIIAWNYPQEEKNLFLLEERNLEAEENNILVSTTLDKVNFDYKICGAKSNSRPTYPWTPLMVFDDGFKTYIKMPDEMKSTEAPVLFAKDNDIKKGKDKSNLVIVNYRVKGGYYIVDQIMDEFELHSGEKSIVRIIRQKKD